MLFRNENQARFGVARFALCASINASVSFLSAEVSVRL